MGRTWTVLICVQVAVAVGALPAVVGIAWNYIPQPTPNLAANEILWFMLRSPSSSSGAASVQPDYAVLQAELLRRVQALPDVSDVTLATAGAPDMTPWCRIEVEGAPEIKVSTSRTVGVDVAYFDVLDATCLAGRSFNRNDAVAGATAAIVSRAFVDEYIGGNALGRRFREVNEVGESGPWFEIVGVVEDMVRRGREPMRQVFHPIALGTEPLDLMARKSGNRRGQHRAARSRDRP